MAETREFDVNRDLAPYVKAVRAVRHENDEMIVLNEDEVAHPGDWLVWEEGVPRVVSPDTFEAYYDEAGDATTQFHRELYWRSLGQMETFVRWRDVAVIKSPLDMLIYAELIHREEPEVLIEAGTHTGGSAMYFQDVMAAGAGGKVITIEIEPDQVKHRDSRITYIEGNSVDPEVVKHVSKLCKGKRTMVSLDSDHGDLHVLREMEAYGPLVTRGCYMVVEDTNTSGHPVDNGPLGAGPWHAVEMYFKTHDDFEQDRDCEKFGITFHPGGWLRKV